MVSIVPAILSCYSSPISVVILMLRHVVRLRLPMEKESIPNARLLNTDPQDQAIHADTLPYKDLLQPSEIHQSISEHKIDPHKSHNLHCSHLSFCNDLIYKILV